MKAPKVIVLRTAGTNCDKETAFAFEAAGAMAELVHINELARSRKDLGSYHILAIPGGETGGSLMIDGKPVAKGDREFIAFNLKPDSSGTMYYTRTFENLRYNGGAEGFTFT